MAFFVLEEFTMYALIINKRIKKIKFQLKIKLLSHCNLIVLFIVRTTRIGNKVLKRTRNNVYSFFNLMK